MSIQPLTQWRCDVCKKAIEQAGDGYLTWHTASGRPHSFQLIHHVRCDDNEASHSAALADYLGADGLTRLMAFLSYGPLRSESTPAGPRDMNEFADLVRRLQVPYYEEARVHFSNYDVRENRSDWNEHKPYMVDELKKLAESGV